MGDFCCRALLLVVAVVALGSAAQSAVIMWGPATNIAGDTDVSTDGQLERAFNFGLRDTSAGPFGSTTVNGVLFEALASNGDVPLVRNATDNTRVFAFGSSPVSHVLASNTFGATADAPFNTLSESYKLLLSTGFYADGPTMSLTLSGLTIGQEYQIQVFVNDSRSGVTNRVGISSPDDGYLWLDTNISNSEGDLGQFRTGAFTADNTVQMVLFIGSNPGTGDTAHLNAFQLRTIPEPTASLLLAGAGVALGGLRRFRRTEAFR